MQGLSISRNISYTQTPTPILVAPKTMMPQSYQSDEHSRNHRLLEGILFEYDVDSLFECMNKCNEWAPKCKAFSYSDKSRQCLLNKLKKGDALKSAFVYKAGFLYYEVM